MRKLHKINATTYEADFTRARVEIGDIDSDKFIPCCKMYNFEDETSLKVTYVDRPYSMLSDPEPAELDKLVLTEAVHYPPYEIGIWYDAGDLLEYNGGLYEVVQGHTSQEDWSPDTTSALYKTSTPPGVIGEWKQPEGAHDAYAIDTKVYHIGKIWVSIIDANVWEPGVYGWEETTGQVDVECYCVDGIGEQNVSGFEFEIVLRGKPESNVIEMAIETEGLKFYYQPELTQEEIDEGAYRPENVIGSYTVYHATVGNVYKGQADAEKYKTGKAFHIYRPKVYDANGDWVWGELSINAEAGILSITVDPQWLDSAVYPVRVDPTFGYVDANGDGIVGESTTAASADRIYGWAFACPESAITSSISIYCYREGDAFNGRACIYDDNGFSPSQRQGYSGEVTFEDTVQWHNFNIEVSLSEDLYWIGLIVNASAAYLFHYFYDTGDTGQQADQGHSYGIPPETFPDPVRRDRVGSIYSTYEEPPPPGPILAAVQENGRIKLTISKPPDPVIEWPDSEGYIYNESVHEEKWTGYSSLGSTDKRVDHLYAEAMDTGYACWYSDEVDLTDFSTLSVYWNTQLTAFEYDGEAHLEVTSDPANVSSFVIRTMVVGVDGYRTTSLDVSGLNGQYHVRMKVLMDDKYDYAAYGAYTVRLT